MWKIQWKQLKTENYEPNCQHLFFWTSEKSFLSQKYLLDTFIVLTQANISYFWGTYLIYLTMHKGVLSFSDLKC